MDFWPECKKDANKGSSNDCTPTHNVQHFGSSDLVFNKLLSNSLSPQISLETKDFGSLRSGKNSDEL